MSAAAFDAIRNTLARGSELLGVMIWWSLADARIDRRTLEHLWSSASLPPEYLPEVPTTEKSLKLAVREASTGQTERLVRLTVENEHDVIFAVVRETKHSDGSATYAQEAKVALDRVAETVTTDQPGHSLAEAILAAYVRLRHTHGSDDIRRAMVKTLDSCAAVTLRDHGGVYFAPAPHAETIRKLQIAVERVGHSRVYLLPIHKSEDAARTLGDVAQSSVEAQLETLKQEIEGFVQAPPARISTLVHRLDAFEALRAKANLYRDILSVHVADLDKTLTELTSSVEKLLAQKQAA